MEGADSDARRSTEADPKVKVGVLGVIGMMGVLGMLGMVGAVGTTHAGGQV